MLVVAVGVHGMPVAVVQVVDVIAVLNRLVAPAVAVGVLGRVCSAWGSVMGIPFRVRPRDPVPLIH